MTAPAVQGIEKHGGMLTETLIRVADAYEVEDLNTLFVRDGRA